MELVLLPVIEDDTHIIQYDLPEFIPVFFG